MDVISLIPVQEYRFRITLTSTSALLFVKSQSAGGSCRDAESS